MWRRIAQRVKPFPLDLTVYSHHCAFKLKGTLFKGNICCNFFLGTQIHDLVSQIKVPVTLPSQPVSKTLLTPTNTSVIGTGIGGVSVEKRRKIEIINRRPVTAQGFLKFRLLSFGKPKSYKIMLFSF